MWQIKYEYEGNWLTHSGYESFDAAKLDLMAQLVFIIAPQKGVDIVEFGHIPISDFCHLGIVDKEGCIIKAGVIDKIRHRSFGATVWWSRKILDGSALDAE